MLRVRQTNTTPANAPDPQAKVQARLLMSINFNTTAIVQSRDMAPMVTVERELAPDAAGILRARIVNQGAGVADLTRLGWAIERDGKQEPIALDEVQYGEALFLEPGRSRDIALSNKIRAPARLIVSQPGDRRGARRS